MKKIDIQVKLKNDKEVNTVNVDRNMETVGKKRGSRVDPSEHPKYVGVYGHPLFSNFTVTSNSTTGDLEFTLGYAGHGRLLRDTGEVFGAEMFHPLDYTQRMGSLKCVYFPLQFADEDSEIGQFNTMLAILIEPFSPPRFVRGLWWDPSGQ